MSDAKVCILCRLLWCVLVIGTCGYVVFWLDHSGWWFLLAVALVIGDCEDYGTEDELRERRLLAEAKARIRREKG